MAVAIVIVAALWVTAAYFVARAAVARGWGFWGFLLLGVFLSPILTASVLAVDAMQGNSAGREPPLDERLATLQQLRASGALTDEEYAVQYAALQEPAPPAAPPA